MTHEALPTAPDLRSAWTALGGDPALPSRVGTVVRAGALPSPLPVRELARACVGAASLAAAELAAERGAPGPVPAVEVDDGAVATSFVSERHLRVGGRAPVAFAPLSRWWRTADGWLRTHANYPHHRTRLLTALGLPADTADEDAVERVAQVLARSSAPGAEETVYAAGGLAVALRTPAAWAAHPQGAAVAGLPLVERAVLPGRPDGSRPLPPPDGVPLLPAAGVRVLDLTRVIAGPVATRTLALLGADVLRIDSPELPELPDQYVDTGFGKRSTALDLASPSGRRTFDALVERADVVVTGYRPGCLDRFGVDPAALAARRPGLVVARLSAWGPSGPWARRRGFDSLVQAACGIAVTTGSPERPGALPAQALDHGSGHLLAAGVLRALTLRQRDGAGRSVGVCLARTAAWLTGIDTGADAVAGAGAVATTDPGPSRTVGAPYRPQTPGGTDRWLTERDGPHGRLRYALPPVRFAGGPTDWATPPGPWGTDPARWRGDPA
ncbi:CoA transferase [Streptomyces sp. NPDC005955]|uniref:CoA transferase n=1 Tax=Streptomyces sp. NPDC005955 TaxID=3364738 RepID=UPI00368C76C5